MEIPSFPKRDPASPEFWDLRYAAGFRPWDAHGVQAQLRDYVASGSPRNVLVPGCGTGWDVRFLADSGWNVVGIDFSAQAVDAARKVLGSHAQRVRRGDFFAPIAGEPFELVYERAFLCALPRRMWSDWATRVASLLVPGGELAGYFFMGAGERGPPFPLRDAAELDALLDARFERIADEAVPDSLEVFKGRERWQRWRRRT